MNIQIDFGIVVVILLIIGNEVTKVLRKLEGIEAKLKLAAKKQTVQEVLNEHGGTADFAGWQLENLEKHIDWRFENAAIDLKNVMNSLECDIKAIEGDKLDGKLDDILEKLDEALSE